MASGSRSSKGQGPLEHTLLFAVAFSAQPQLEVTFLRSYANIGSATLYLGGPGLRDPHSLARAALGSWELQGLVQERFSVPHTVRWARDVSKLAPGVHALPQGVGPGEYRVMLVLNTTAGVAHPKFKLLGITSC